VGQHTDGVNFNMSIFRELRYVHIPRRSVINYNNFFTFLLIGIVFADCAFVFKYYFFYDPVVKIILILGLGGLFTGNLLGRLVHARYANYRFIFILCETLYLLIFILFLLRDIIGYHNESLIVLLFLSSWILIPALIFVTLLLIGMKIHHSLSCSCAESAAKKRGGELYIGIMLAAISLGIIISGIFHSFNVPAEFIIVVPIILLSSIFLMNYRGNRPVIYEKDHDEEAEKPPPPASANEGAHPIFIYLNFIYIIVYSYLGFSGIIKYYGNSPYVELAFIFLLLLVMLAGYLAGRYLSMPHLYIYGGSLFPAAFIVFLILLMHWYGSLYFIAGILLFSPAAFIMGAVLNSTVRTIAVQYDDATQSTIIEFALVIMPTSILISMLLVNFTNFWYYVVSGALMIVNVIVPAVYMANSRTAVYRKALYFAYSLVFLPLFIFIVKYYSIPLNSNVYVTKVGNFDVLLNVNYDADYINKDRVITMGSLPAFHVSDSVVRNLKRSLVPVPLFHPEGKRILFIDANQKFFRNPLIGYFENSNCLDVLSDRDVDYQKLPLTGDQTYVPDQSGPLLYFEGNREGYFTIVDVPNILDQNYNPFRFSIEYYAIIKKRLVNNGVFVQTFSIPDCRRGIFSLAVSNLRRSFKKQIIFFFSDILVIMSSDDDKAFELNQTNYARFVKFFAAHEELKKLFLNEQDVFSHLVYVDMSGMMPDIPEGRLSPAFNLTTPAGLQLKQSFYDDYIGSNKRILDLIPKSSDQYYLNRVVDSQIIPYDTVLNLLKKTELAEAQGNYHDETRYLFELKRMAEFRIDIQGYVFSILNYKEKYYYDLALRFEKNKKWDEAKELYGAVLTINNDNFDANYRMGLLCLTLQDIDDSFKYFQQAMRINRNHPKVLFQMGILYFSIGKIPEAIDYFNQALRQNEKSPSIYRYLGMCFQQQGNLYEAEKYFSKALLADPNDVDSKNRLEEVRSRIEKESKKWETPEQKNESDVEQDAEMPLPISKGAYDIRLKDNDSSLPVVDPRNGETIPGAGGGKK
jgi:tetratricopeptide (TPR) repeat protein